MGVLKLLSSLRKKLKDAKTSRKKDIHQQLADHPPKYTAWVCKNFNSLRMLIVMVEKQMFSLPLAESTTKFLNYSRVPSVESAKLLPEEQVADAIFIYEKSVHGEVPLLRETSDSDSNFMCEPGAVMFYLQKRSQGEKLFPPEFNSAGDLNTEYFTALEKFFETERLAISLKLMFDCYRPLETKNDVFLKAEVHKYLAKLNQQCSASPHLYILGTDHMTLPDITLFSCIWALYIYLEETKTKFQEVYPFIHKHYEKMLETSSISEILKMEQFSATAE